MKLPINEIQKYEEEIIKQISVRKICIVLFKRIIVFLCIRKKDS